MTFGLALIVVLIGAWWFARSQKEWVDAFSKAHQLPSVEDLSDMFRDNPFAYFRYGLGSPLVRPRTLLRRTGDPVLDALRLRVLVAAAVLFLALFLLVFAFVFAEGNELFDPVVSLLATSIVVGWTITLIVARRLSWQLKVIAVLGIVSGLAVIAAAMLGGA
jgi:hypothetical protein